VISLPLDWLVLAYVLAFLGIIFVVWAGGEILRHRREKQALRHRLRCALCGMEFEDVSPAGISRCPGCGSLNERTRIRRW